MTIEYKVWSDPNKVSRRKEHEHQDYYDPSVPSWAVVFEETTHEKRI